MATFTDNRVVCQTTVNNEVLHNAIVTEINENRNDYLPGLGNNILWSQYIVQYNKIYCKAKPNPCAKIKFSFFPTLIQFF